MNRLRNLRPLAGAAVLAVAAMSAAPAFAALPHASASSLSRMSQQALSAPALFQGTVLGLHRPQLAAEISLANGAFIRVRFASVAQQQRLHVGSHLIVSGIARNQARLLVRSLRIMGTSTRAHIQGKVARRLSRSAIELLGTHGAAVTLNLGHARVTRVLYRAGRFVRTAASVAPGEQLDASVTLSGAGAEATGTATVTPPSPAPSAMQVEVEGIITAVDPAAGTITVRDDEGFASVVSVSAAGTYSVGQEVDVTGTPTGPGGSATTVRAQYVTLDLDDAPVPAAAPVGAYVKVKGFITAVNAAAGTITVQDDDAPFTVVALGAAGGTYYAGQDVEVAGIMASAGSNGATVQAQFIRLKSPDRDDGD